MLDTGEGFDGDMSMQVHYSRLFANPDGASCFETLTSEFKPGFAAPPAEPLYAA